MLSPHISCKLSLLIDTPRYCPILPMRGKHEARIKRARKIGERDNIVLRNNSIPVHEELGRVDEAAFPSLDSDHRSGALIKAHCRQETFHHNLNHARGK